VPAEKRKANSAAGLLLAATLLLPTGAGASIIFQSATLGTTDGPSVVIENDSTFEFALGVRFQVTSTVQVTGIGGGVWSLTQRELFGELFALSGPADLPSGDPLNSDPLALVSFVAPTSLQDFSVPLSITLTPGYYGLVFGAYPSGSVGGVIGPEASGLMTIDGSDLPGTDASSYFEYAATTIQVSPGQGPQCRVAGRRIRQRALRGRRRRRARTRKFRSRAGSFGFADGTPVRPFPALTGKGVKRSR